MSPEPFDGETAGFGSAVAARTQPRTGWARSRSNRLARGPGVLAARLARFASWLGATPPTSAGLERGAMADPSDASVRPPIDPWLIDPWLWGENEHPLDAATAASGRAPSRRGLPLTVRRSMRAGGAVGPGAIARRLRPSTEASPPPSMPEVLSRGRRPATTARASDTDVPAGLPPDLAALQRSLIRGGLLQPGDDRGGASAAAAPPSGRVDGAALRDTRPVDDTRAPSSTDARNAGIIDRSSIRRARPVSEGRADSRARPLTEVPGISGSNNDRSAVSAGPAGADPSGATVAPDGRIDRGAVRRVQRVTGAGPSPAPPRAPDAGRPSNGAPAASIAVGRASPVDAPSATVEQRHEDPTGSHTVAPTVVRRPGESAQLRASIDRRGLDAIRRSRIAPSDRQSGDDRDMDVDPPGQVGRLGTQTSRIDRDTVDGAPRPRAAGRSDSDREQPTPRTSPPSSADRVMRSADLVEPATLETRAGPTTTHTDALRRQPGDGGTRAPVAGNDRAVMSDRTALIVARADVSTSVPAGERIGEHDAMPGRTIPRPPQGRLDRSSPAVTPAHTDAHADARLDPTTSAGLAGKRDAIDERAVRRLPRGRLDRIPPAATPAHTDAHLDARLDPTTSPGLAGQHDATIQPTVRRLPQGRLDRIPPAATPAHTDAHLAGFTGSDLPDDLTGSPAEVPAGRPEPTVERPVRRVTRRRLDRIRRAAPADRADHAAHEAAHSDPVDVARQRAPTEARGDNRVRPPAGAPHADDTASDPVGDVPRAPQHIADRADRADRPLVPRLLDQSGLDRARRARVSTPLPVAFARPGRPDVQRRAALNVGDGAIGSALRAESPTAPLASRFMSELSRRRAAQTRPLPERWQPMSAIITGGDDVRVSTDIASRRSLRAVGKVAATVDDVIHLDRPIEQVRPDVVAHELTHVAHRSPEPRFFDDDRRGPEERQAEAVAKLMRSAAPSLVQRSPSNGAVTADALATQITAGTTAPGTIQRWKRGAPSGPPTIGRGRTARSQPATDVPAPQPVPVPLPSAPPEPVPPQAAQPEPAASEVAAVAPPDLTAQFDRILELLEERILTELERRGGRLRGGF